MAELVYTTDDLVESVRQRTMVADLSASGTSDADIIRLLNEEMLSEIVPAVRKEHEDYFVAKTRMTLTSGTSAYRVPVRAIGSSLRNVFYKAGTYLTALPHIGLEKKQGYATDSTGSPVGYHFSGHYLELIPAPDAANELEIYYFLRPGQLTLVENTAVVQSVSGKQVTCTATLPTAWTTSTIFDIHSEESGAELKASNLTVAAKGANTLTFNEDIDGTTFGTYSVDAGDYVCVKGLAAVPSVPRELHPVLAHAAACRLVEALGDTEKLKVLVAELNRMMARLPSIIGQRVEGEPRRVTPIYSPLWQQGAMR